MAPCSHETWLLRALNSDQRVLNILLYRAGGPQLVVEVAEDPSQSNMVTARRERGNGESMSLGPCCVVGEGVRLGTDLLHPVPVMVLP